MATAPKPSEFVALVLSELKRLRVMTGRSADKHAVAAQLEAEGMTAGDLRTVVAWFESDETVGPGRLVHVLHSEEEWRDVVDVERPHQERAAVERAEAAHYPNMRDGGYEPNPIIRELGRTPPFSDRDAVDAYRANLGVNLWALACHLGWSDDAERHASFLDDIEPPGVERLRGVLSAAGIETPRWSARPKETAETKAQAAERRRKDERHDKAAALFRVHAGKARQGDAKLIAGWDPQSEVEA